MLAAVSCSLQTKLRYCVGSIVKSFKLYPALFTMLVFSVMSGYNTATKQSMERNKDISAIIQRCDIHQHTYTQ